MVINHDRTVRRQTARTESVSAVVDLSSGLSAGVLVHSICTPPGILELIANLYYGNGIFRLRGSSEDISRR
jgi:hypothetical protein